MYRLVRDAASEPVAYSVQAAHENKYMHSKAQLVLVRHKAGFCTRCIVELLHQTSDAEPCSKSSLVGHACRLQSACIFTLLRQTQVSTQELASPFGLCPSP